MGALVTNQIGNVTTLGQKGRKRGFSIAKSVTTFLATVTILAGCQTTSKGSFCQIAEAHRPSQAAIDAMSDAEVRTLLSHNRKGAALCGWKP